MTYLENICVYFTYGILMFLNNKSDLLLTFINNLLLFNNWVGKFIINYEKKSHAKLLSSKRDYEH